MLLNFLQCTEQPPQQRIIWLNVSTVLRLKLHGLGHRLVPWTAETLAFHGATIHGIHILGFPWGYDPWNPHSILSENHRRARVHHSTFPEFHHFQNTEAQGRHCGNTNGGGGGGGVCLRPPSWVVGRTRRGLKVWGLL